MGANERIITRLVNEWCSHQTAKAKDYNSDAEGIEPADVLGLKGQFADIWRKIWKLKKALWDGKELTGEQPREILLDLIGHCFLAIDMLDRQQPEVKSDKPKYLKDVTGHKYDGCPGCANMRTLHPELIV